MNQQVTPKDLETKDVAVVREKVSGAVSAAESMSKGLKSDAKYDEASEMLANIKKVGKLITQEKKKQLDPANATVTAIRDFWKPIEDQYKDAEKVLASAVLKYKQKIDARNAKKEETISKKLQEGKLSFEKASEQLEQKKTEATRAGLKSRVTKNLRYKPVEELSPYDLATLAKLGFIDWSNKSVLRRAALGGTKIPGVEIYEEESIVG